jgi:outer membrane protein TolC
VISFFASAVTKRQRLTNRLAALVLACSFAAPPAEAQPAAPVDALIETALDANPTLARFRAAQDAAEAGRRAARAAYGPTVGVEARGTYAEGGRAIDLPLGQLLNPVYETLDGLRAADGLPPAFPRLDDQSIPLARTEGDVRLVVEQPVYAPAIGSGIRVARAQQAAAEASLQAYRVELAAAVRAAYWRLQGAERGVEAQRASLARVAEFQRVAERQRAAGSGLRVAVVRASAEALAVDEALREAERARSLALADLNRLLGRPLGTPVAPLPDGAVPLPDVPPAGPLRVALAASASEATGRRPRTLGLDELQDAAAAGRAELAALDAAVEARDAAVGAARSGFRPTVGVRLDLGASGGEDQLDDPFVLGSAVVRWRPFGAPGDRARVAAARAEVAAARAERDAAERGVRLQVQDAYERLAVAYAALRTSAERAALSAEAFRLTSQLVALGDANQADFVDAQASLTQADLGRTAARFDVLARLAELEGAVGLPLRLDLSPTPDTARR